MRKKVLFLCTGNSARSQMAEAWAKHLGSDVADFYSAGTWPSREINRFAIRVMAERGVSVEDTLPKSFTSIPKPLDLIVAVCGQAAEECPVPPPGTEVHRWDLPDPAQATGTDEEILQVFRDSRDEIEKQVQGLLRSFDLG